MFLRYFFLAPLLAFNVINLILYSIECSINIHWIYFWLFSLIASF